MKGKKIFRNCIGALALLLGLAGCQNSLEGDSVSGEGIEGLRTLTVEIKNYSEFVEESSVQANMFAPARSIMPDAFKTSDTLSYYLYGKASNGEEKEWTSVTVKNGKFTLDVEPYNWNLTLAVTADAATKITEADDLAAVKGKAVLIGYAAVDLTRHANSASFTLKPDGLTTPGHVGLKTSLEGNWTIPDSINSVRLGIYNLTTGEAISYTTDKSTTVTEVTDSGSGIAFPTSFGDSTKDLAPGTYTFKVEFLDADDNCQAEWSDSIVILPGKTNDKTVAVPNVIGEKPAAATDFTASYVSGTEDSTDGFYDVKFEWNGDACKNERNFEIDLLDVTGSTVAAIPTKDEEWNTAVTDSGNKVVTYKSEVISDQLYVEGSLLANNTSLTMKLPLGKAYVARIRAVNRAGSSDNAYVTVGTGKGTEKVFEGTFINLFRIRYNLQGGTYTPDGETAQTAPIVDYASKETAYRVPDATNTLVKNNISWTKWQVDDKEDKKDKKDIDLDTTPKYSGPKNIDLYACYTTDADVNIFNAADYKLDASWITVGKNNVALTGTDPSYTVTVSKAKALDTDGALIWTVTVADKNAKPITTGFAYDSVKIEVSSVGISHYTQTQADVAVGTPATFTQTGAKLLESGTYNVMITATEGTTTVTLPVVLTITD